MRSGKGACGLSAVAREEHTRQVVAGDIVRIERAERDHAILEAVG